MFRNIFLIGVKSMLELIVSYSLLIFLFFMNLFADFFKFSKCRLFIKILENLQKMVLNLEKLEKQTTK